VPGLGRKLAESTRYARLAARGAARGRTGQVLDPTYGRRFGLLLAFAFLLEVFYAPSSQFSNEYLGDERGFSGLDVTVFRAVTGGAPGLLGLVVGGRLAETWGRKPVALASILLGVAATVLFFLQAGVTLWLFGTVQIFVLGAVSPAVGALWTEMFPTEVRGTANAYLLVAGVMGSATGLLIAGVLSDSISLGGAVAWTGLAPVVGAVLLLPWLPEAAFRDLEEVSPSEV
jgi:MFS family permease